jgi:hypothetical protein
MKLSPLIEDLANDKINLLFSEKNWVKQKKEREKKSVYANLFEDENYQRIGYISHTATIMHGHFIQELYEQAVSSICKNLKVWKEEKFKISSDAFDISGRQNNMSVLTAELPYGDVHRIAKKAKTRSIDFLTFNEQTGKLCSYEIKRGGTTHDSEKKEKIVSNLIAVQVLLKNYGISKKLIVKKARTYIISHYNTPLLPTQWDKLQVNGNNIDDHFGKPIKDQLLRGEEYFKSQFNSKLRKFKELLN